MSEDANPVHPGAFVKENVIPKEVSVKGAAEMMGVGRPALSNFLNGKASLSQKMATRLAKTFGINKGDLLALQQEYDSFLNREEEKRIAVKSYTPSFLKITATHIETWAEKIDARSMLPALLRRLVNTTGGEIVSSNFPAYDKSQTPGWDGVVESNNNTPWIPSGSSGWEFGCNKTPRTKANDDYKMRTKLIPESERKKTTYVFVTPRSWSKKDDWIKEIKEKNEWKEVRAFDAGDIEQWLELSVPAQVWMAEQLGLPTSECQSLNNYWRFWSQTAKPAISSKIFNSSITDHAEKVINWYQSQPVKPFVITAASKEEAKAFLCCLADQANNLKPLLDQAVFVSSPLTVKRLAENSTNFIPVAYTDDAQHELVVAFDKRHSIIIAERNIKRIEPDICLDLPSSESFKQALKDMGIDDAQIDVYANQSGHSPTILRRQLSKTPALGKPEWIVSAERLRTMIPLTLAGSWNVGKEADKEILSCLANRSYSDVEKDIARLVSLDDAPIWSEGKYRGVISELECFYAISDHLTEKDIDNFFDLAEYVLSEDDPSLDLEKENRWAANIYNKVRGHSSAIRENICQNLIILAVHGNGLFGQRLGLDIEKRVSYLISVLLTNKNARVWQAQQSDLPRYAEAAPDTFLSIVEKELQQVVPAFQILFEPVDSGMFSRCERTGMLWALELLAWRTSLLARVVKVLGKLSMYELDDNWANKPINSLKDILLIWRPHTAASIVQRCEVLELLCNQYPEIGWKICIEPLEPGNSFTSGTYRPSWRGDASGAGNNVTYEEARRYRQKCLELVLSWQSHSVTTLKGLVNCMSSMEDKDKRKVIEQVRHWVNSSSEEELITLREHVRTRTMTTRALRRNKKQNDNQDYVCGKELYELLEPKSLLLKHLWLFAKGWVEYTPEELEGDNFDHEAREEGLRTQRIQALKEIFADQSIQGLLDLLKKSSAGFHIGNYLYHYILEKKDIPDFILKCLSADEKHRYEADNCISGIMCQFEDAERGVLISQLIKRLSTFHDKKYLISRLFILSPFSRNTWKLLEVQGEDIQNSYWQTIHPSWNRLSSEELSFAVAKLLIVNRPLAAFSLSHYKFEMIESDTIVVLLNAIANNISENDSNYTPDKYDIEQALKKLNERNDFDRMELVKLEYLYVDILHSHSSYGIPNLAKEVSKSPLLFMQLVAYSYKRSDGGEDPAEWNIPQDKEQKSIFATKAYHVLDCLSIIPGTQENDFIDIGRLRDWILQVRELAREHGRESITDQQIGKLLSTSPEDDNGIWPVKEIRDVFEETGSSEISIGMELGVYNNLKDGLEPVDTLRKKGKAEKYKQMAEKVMNKTPFVGKMLLNISQMHLQDAMRWESDDRIRKRLKGW